MIKKRILGENINKIFVTGGAGFIGSHLADILLSQQYEVTVYDNLSNGHLEYISHNLDLPNFNFIKGDIIDSEKLVNSLCGHDLVWHLAANSDIISGHENPRRDLNDSIIGTFNVVDAMRLNEIIPIIFSSSGAVYGDLCKEESTSEFAGPLLPVSNYAAGKIGSEAFLSAFCNLYGLRSWIFRFGNVVGSRMTHGVIFDFINNLKKNPKELLIRGDGKQEKNYFLVEECIEGMAFAYKNVKLDDEKPCTILNLGTDSITKVIDIAKIIKSEMNLPNAKIKIEGKKLAWPGDQPKVHISVDEIQRIGWKAKLHSDQAVRTAVKRMLNKEDSFIV